MKKIILLIFACHLSAQLPQKVLICGVCKNEERRLPFSIKIIEKIGALFADYRAIVYENNSSDNTPRILKNWQSHNEKVHIISEFIEQKKLEHIIINRVKNGGFFVPEAIAHARNNILEYIENNQFEEFNYVIWMDLDFKVEPSYTGFVETFQTDKEWDAVFAYGIDPHKKYWDWYALRDDVCPLGSELLGNDWWYMPKKLSLNTQSNWYPVYSAFGGCGIYKKEAIKGCRYSGVVTSDLGRFSKTIIENYPSHPVVQKYKLDLQKVRQYISIDSNSQSFSDVTNPASGIIVSDCPDGIVWRMSSFVYKYPSICEHVPLHASMITKGYNKLFINPRLIFNYGG